MYQANDGVIVDKLVTNLFPLLQRIILKYLSSRIRTCGIQDLQLATQIFPHYTETLAVANYELKAFTLYFTTLSTTGRE